MRTHKHDDAAAIEWGLKAIALAEQLGARESYIQALNLVGVARWHRGDSGGRAQLERCLVLGREAGIHSAVGLAYVNLVSIGGELHQFDVAEKYVDAGIRWCDEHDLDHYGQATMAGVGRLLWRRLTRSPTTRTPPLTRESSP